MIWNGYSMPTCYFLNFIISIRVGKMTPLSINYKDVVETAAFVWQINTLGNTEESKMGEDEYTFCSYIFRKKPSRFEYWYNYNYYMIRREHLKQEQQLTIYATHLLLRICKKQWFRSRAKPSLTKCSAYILYIHKHWLLPKILLLLLLSLIT